VNADWENDYVDDFREEALAGLDGRKSPYTVAQRRETRAESRRICVEKCRVTSPPSPYNTAYFACLGRCK